MKWIALVLLALLAGCTAPREPFCRFEDEAHLALPEDAFPERVREALLAEGWNVTTQDDGSLRATRELGDGVEGRITAWATGFASGGNHTAFTSVRVTALASGPPSRAPVDVESSAASTLERLRGFGTAPVPPVPPTRDGSPSCIHGD